MYRLPSHCSCLRGTGTASSLGGAHYCIAPFFHSSREKPQSDLGLLPFIQAFHKSYRFSFAMSLTSILSLLPDSGPYHMRAVNQSPCFNLFPYRYTKKNPIRLILSKKRFHLFPCLKNYFPLSTCEIKFINLALINLHNLSSNSFHTPTNGYLF